MKHYEVTFIVDPVLSGDEIKATAQVYEEMLKNEQCTIVHINEMGLQTLAYPINRRSTGVYYCTEFAAENGSMISKLELSLRRDERIMRFLTVSVDKYGVKYNDDKRNGLIGKVKKKVKAKKEDDRRGRSSRPAPKKAEAPKPAPAPAPAPAPVAAASSEEE